MSITKFGKLSSARQYFKSVRIYRTSQVLIMNNALKFIISKQLLIISQID